MFAPAPFTFPHPAAEPRNRHEDFAALERDAAALPADGPLADLVSALSAELHRLVIADRTSHEAAPFLRRFGKEAHALTGSVRGMRAVCHRAARLDPRHAERRRDMLDKAWNGIGDASGTWVA